MPIHTCNGCHKSYKSYSDLQHIDSILESGLCCDCRDDAAFCTKCNHYYFNEEAHLIINNESELCYEHYQDFFDYDHSLHIGAKKTRVKETV